MAVDKSDNQTQNVAFPVTSDKDWLRLGVDTLIQSNQRSMQKYPAGSPMAVALAGNIQQLRKIRETL